MVALVLCSGGLDSTVLLALACEEKSHCYALSFNYGQKHHIELEAAAKVAKHFEVPHIIINLPKIDCSSCSLLNTKDLKVPKDRSMKEIQNEETNTYIPARNTLFLSYAMQQAELIEATEIYIGANEEDYINYPDCRPEYFEMFQNLMNFSTRQGLSGKAPQLKTPFIKWNKETIICQGDALQAPLDLTWSCYDPQENLHCGCCDACLFRQRGFVGADVEDPTTYANKLASSSV
jgi:7-cyano-7-deazaguanine synthase